MKWLRGSLSNLASKARSLREMLVATAQTVQYESAAEPGRQLGVEMPPEPFTARQQRQSRMDGGQEEDGSIRSYVPLAPPVEQPHMAREERLASAQNRQPMVGADAYRNLPITGALQASFPSYRRRSSFGNLCAPESSDSAAAPQRGDRAMFRTNVDGQAIAALTADGS